MAVADSHWETLVSPEEWAGSGVGVGMLSGGVDSSAEKLIVSKIQSFKVPNFQNVKVPNFQNFKVSKTKIPNYKFQMFKHIGTHISRFPNVANLICPNIYCFRKIIWDFLDFFKYPGVSKIKNNWFWESWSHPLGPKTMKLMGFRVFPN